MLFSKILLTILLLIIMPWCIGLLFKREGDGALLTPVYGYIFTWAVSFAICVPLIIRMARLTTFIKYDGVVLIVVSLIGILAYIIRRRRGQYEKKEKAMLSRTEMICLALFLGVVLFQLYKSVFYAYSDGDDAFYVATSNVAVSSDSMYVIDAYQGIAGIINYRYALAPFPMWVAGIAKVTGISTAILSHTVLPVFLILITYIIFNEISKVLFGEDREKRYMFMTLVAVYEMFSNVSHATSGTFLLTRARQGKEALANIIIPFLFLAIIRIVKREGEVLLSERIILIVACTASALTSLFGNILAPFMVLSLMIFCFVKKRGFISTILLGVSVIPNMAAVLLYVMKGAL